MERLEELIKDLPREIKQKAIDILEYFLQKADRQAKSSVIPESWVPSSTPALPSAPPEHPLAKWQIEVALARAKLLRLYLQAVGPVPWGQRTRAGRDFIRDYNMGLSFPELFDKLRKVSYPTLQRWAKVGGRRANRWPWCHTMASTAWDSRR